MGKEAHWNSLRPSPQCEKCEKLRFAWFTAVETLFEITEEIFSPRGSVISNQHVAAADQVHDELERAKSEYHEHLQSHAVQSD